MRRHESRASTSTTMAVFTVVLRLLSTITLVRVVTSCPGSPARVHAKCEFTVTFPNSPCRSVREEILARGSHRMGWKDPHNGGTYSVEHTMTTTTTTTTIEGSHLTGHGNYTDRLDFVLKDSTTGGGGSSGDCEVTACSESQVYSVLDGSTNYCNLRMLYCNRADGCEVLVHDLEYEEHFDDGSNCSQRKKTKCLTKKTV